MIKVIREDGNLYYLSEYAYSHLEFRKKEGVLIAYPIIPKLPEVKLLGVKCIIDNVKVEEIHQGPDMTDSGGDHKTDKGHNRPISELIDHLRASKTPILITKLSRFFKAHEIVTVDDLVSIGKERFSEYRGIGILSVKAISDALNEFYGIRSW